MKTWDDYKEYVKSIDDENRRQIKEIEKADLTEFDKTSCQNPHKPCFMQILEKNPKKVLQNFQK